MTDIDFTIQSYHGAGILRFISPRENYWFGGLTHLSFTHEEMTAIGVYGPHQYVHLEGLLGYIVNCMKLCKPYHAQIHSNVPGGILVLNEPFNIVELSRLIGGDLDRVRAYFRTYATVE